MFTGIIEEIGHIKAMHRGAKSITLDIAASKVMEGTAVGDSISTNGVCLTVTSLTPAGFTADVMPETVRRTALSALKAGSEVNLERALTLQTRLGGHIVQGHVDGIGTVIDRQADDNALWLTIECGADLMRYIISKGSITIQGVSLTVAKVTPSTFSVSLIPHTQGVTTLHSARVGDKVNLETDIIAKYVEKMLSGDKDDAGKMALYRNFMMS